MSATDPLRPTPEETSAERPARSHGGQLALMLLLAFAAACGHVQMGDSDLKPFWRRPGPALMEPQERRVLQDDGYVAQRGTAAGQGIG
jgi:hypothetical protein